MAIGFDIDESGVLRTGPQGGTLIGCPGPVGTSSVLILSALDAQPVLRFTKEHLLVEAVVAQPPVAPAGAESESGSRQIRLVLIPAAGK